MKTLFILFLSLWVGTNPEREPVLNKEEAQKAFALLQQIRANPNQYAQALRYPMNLKVSKIVLKWNDTLARAAEDKALDMARRNYFSHTDKEGYGMNYRIYEAGYKLNPDWIKNKKANNFESIAYNSNGGEDAIRNLIIDADSPDKGHRQHLLGLGDWYGSMTDIGIGYAEVKSGYGTESYMCVLIAKHNW